MLQQILIQEPMPINLTIFASGAGTNAANIIEHFNLRKDICINLIVCNNKTAGVLQVGIQNNIETILIDRTLFTEGLVGILAKKETNFIILAGFLWKLPENIVGAFPNCILNIHPALLPNYGGKGMYGSNVHKAVIGNKDLKSGITIHVVDEEYDNGKILFQATCPVELLDSDLLLAEKIHILEHEHFPEVIESYILSSTNVPV